MSGIKLFFADVFESFEMLPMLLLPRCEAPLCTSKRGGLPQVWFSTVTPSEVWLTGDGVEHTRLTASMLENRTGVQNNDKLKKSANLQYISAIDP